jgi:hypothetical protein
LTWFRVSVCLRWTLLGLALAVVVAFAAALERLFPSAPALASVGLLRTLALPLASLAFELAALAGIPLGFALGVVRLRPALRGLALLLAIPALLAASMLLLSRQVDLKDDSPGDVVERLIAAAKQSCSPGADDVEVPIVKMKVRCGDRRLAGAAPIGKATFSAMELEAADDLSRLALTGFELALPARKELPGLRVQAGHARIRGLRPWGRSRSNPSVRFWSAWLAVVASSGVAGLLVRRQQHWRALFIGLGCGLGMAAAALALDRAPSAWGLLLLPLAGVAVALVAQLSWDLTRELVAHLQTLPLRRRRAIARAAGRW